MNTLSVPHDDEPRLMMDIHGKLLGVKALEKRVAALEAALAELQDKLRKEQGK